MPQAESDEIVTFYTEYKNLRIDPDNEFWPVAQKTWDEIAADRATVMAGKPYETQIWDLDENLVIQAPVPNVDRFKRAKKRNLTRRRRPERSRTRKLRRRARKPNPPPKPSH